MAAPTRMPPSPAEPELTPELAPELAIDRHHAVTTDGWVLDLKRTLIPARLKPRTRPVLIIPGYGMNSFIFGFHPRGTSMERCLAEAGFEVWSADLRGQGKTLPRTGDHIGLPPGPSLRAYVKQDLPALIDCVLGASRTHARRLDLIGCSLGGSIAYAHLALLPDTPVQALCTIGAPLRWTDVHPLVKTAFGSPWLAARLVIRGVRPLARAGTSLLRRFPRLLAPYMNAAHVDLSAMDEMLETVEDPHPRVNRDIAHWMRQGDLVLDGVNVTAALKSERRPLLVVLSNKDGIVPASANLSAIDAWGGTDTAVLRVGDDERWYAHADLFIGDQCPSAVFSPIAEWLHTHSGGTFKEL